MAIDEKKLLADLEDESRLIPPIEENRDMFYFYSGWNTVVVGLRCLVNKQPKLSLEIKTSDKWIPCSERLPEEHENYIVTVCDECNLIWAETVVVLAEYFEGSWLWYEGGKEYDITDMVIAWMPLPEAYKGEE